MKKLREILIGEFKENISHFDMNDEEIKRKYYHSFRVMSQSMLLAKRVGLNESDAEIVAHGRGFHDIARFP